MILKIHASMGRSFVISGAKPEAPLGGEERNKEAEALAYALIEHLPGNTISQMLKHLTYLRTTIEDEDRKKFMQKLKQSAEECEL